MVSYHFLNPVSSSIDLAKTAAKLLDEIFIEGYHYKRAGVWINDFVPENERLISLFEEDHFDRHKTLWKQWTSLTVAMEKIRYVLAIWTSKSNYGRKKLSANYEDFKNNTLPGSRLQIPIIVSVFKRYAEPQFQNSAQKH